MNADSDHGINDSDIGLSEGQRPPVAKTSQPTPQPVFTPSRQPRVLWHASPEILQ